MYQITEACNGCGLCQSIGARMHLTVQAAKAQRYKEELL
jgi:hypothetical protein